MQLAKPKKTSYIQLHHRPFNVTKHIAFKQPVDENLAQAIDKNYASTRPLPAATYM
jgi:hypothetical protein